MHDDSGLQRFVDAQDTGGVYDDAVSELRAGRKRTHWMWFVFPQLRGLGRSPVARHYAISGVDEAAQYLEHPVLGPRLRECATALLRLPGSDPVEVLGATDAVKLRSSMTLFALAAPEERVFREVLDQYFEGQPDATTTRAVEHPR